jgi:formamidopyrimidine-DNA glycosylase
MPEIPEVEAARHLIETRALDQVIAHVEVRDERVLEVSSQKLWGNLSGHCFASVLRHGKYLLMELDNGCWLVLHFGMTGAVRYYTDPDQESEHSRVLFHFENGAHLAFDNQRLFGEVVIAASAEDFVAAKGLGPDALGLDFATFKQCFSDKRGMVKTALMDQRTLAGIGNVYSDEILFQARLHPRTLVKGLDDDALRHLYEHMQSVLHTATDARIEDRPLPESFLTRHREQGAACPDCGGEVERISISGRNAYYCPDCQAQP